MKIKITKIGNPQDLGGMADHAEADVEFNPVGNDLLKPVGYPVVECFDPNGQLKWIEQGKNAWVDEGREFMINIIANNTASTTPFVGLNVNSTVETDWTMAVQGTSWTEFTDYSEGGRQYYNAGAITDSTTQDNSSNKAAFSINGAGTVRGAFLTTSESKGEATGCMFCAYEFGTERSVADGDTVNVTYTTGMIDDA